MSTNTRQENPIKTVIHFYSFDNETQKDERDALFNRLRKNGQRMIISDSSQRIKRKLDYEAMSRPDNQMEVELSTKYLFSDQWNTTENSGNLRLHNWAGHTAKYISFGYYLDITPEMKTALSNTYQCQYCGHLLPKHEVDAQIAPFCEQCICSEYLTDDNLHLTRMVPVRYGFKKKIPPVSGDVYEFLRRRRKVKIKNNFAGELDNLKKQYRDKLLHDTANALTECRLKCIAAEKFSQDLFVNANTRGPIWVSKITQKGPALTEEVVRQMIDYLKVIRFERAVKFRFKRLQADVELTYFTEEQE